MGGRKALLELANFHGINIPMYECMLSHLSCVPLWDPTNWSPPGSSVHGILQARIMEFPCPPPGDLPNPGTEPTLLTSPALVGWIFTTSTTWEALAQFQPPLLKQVCKPLWLQWASMSELHILLWSKYIYFLQRTYHSLFYLLSYQSSLLDYKRIKADILSYSFPYIQYLLNK